MGAGDLHELWDSGRGWWAQGCPKGSSPMCTAVCALHRNPLVGDVPTLGMFFSSMRAVPHGSLWDSLWAPQDQRYGKRDCLLSDTCSLWGSKPVFITSGYFKHLFFFTKKEFINSAVYLPSFAAVLFMAS